MDNLDKIITDFNLQISQIKNQESLEEVRIHFLGKKGLVTEAFANLKNLEGDEKKSFGSRINEIRSQITLEIDNAKAAFETAQLNEKLKDENMLSGALKSLFAVAEAYPDLKSNTNFMQMQRDLTDTEDKIQAARRLYNGTVRDYNTQLQVFPTNLFASMFSFTAREFFDIDEKGVEGQPVKVQF